MNVELVRARAGNLLYAVSDGELVVYVSARPRGLEKRLRKAAARLERDNRKRAEAIAKWKASA